MEMYELTTGTAIKIGTLDFIYEHTKDASAVQSHDSEALDSKIVQLFSAASIALGLMGLALKTPAIQTSAQYMMYAAVAGYLVTGVASIWVLWVRKLRRSLQADVLWPQYWNEDVPLIKHALVADIVSSYETNKAILKSKKRGVILGLIAVLIEVGLVGGALATATLG